MPDVVNDALALAQFITNGRTEEQAVSFLLALEAVNIDSWRAAKRELGIDDTTNHRTKEQFIKQIVCHMKNEVVDETYCLKNLALLPGCSKEAIELVFYSCATVYSVKKISADIIAQQGTFLSSSRSTNQLAAKTQPSPPLQTIEAVTTESNFPPLVADNRKAALDNTSRTPPAGSWNFNNQLPYKRKSKENKNKSTKKNWVCGSSVSANTDISQQLKFVCLGVRSGAEETVESLTEVLNQWNCVKYLKVEAVRRSSHSTTFRVQYSIPVSLHLKWQQPSAWPTRCWAAEWRGNPKTPLPPLAEKVHKMRVYVGNLSATMTEEKITENMQRIYNEEMKNGVVQKIETVLNQTGLDMARKRHSQDPSQPITMSACVILSSTPGKDLAGIGLKLDHYSYNVRKTVRRWNGPTPRPKTEAVTALDW